MRAYVPLGATWSLIHSKLSTGSGQPGRRLVRPLQMVAVVLTAAVNAGCSDRDQPTAAAAVAPASLAIQAPVPIAVESLTGRNDFTDNVAVQVRAKPDGRPTAVVNLQDASKIAVLRFTIQPGVRFPWHSHPGLVMVSVTQGELIFVHADDCIRRPYPTGTAFVDPGFGHVHYAFNPTSGETIIVATFLGVPPAPAPLTNPVDAATSTALDAKCNVAAVAQTD